MLKNAFENLAVESKQDTANTILANIFTELAAKLEAGQAVALDAATLAALETITVANFPATQAVTGPLTDAQLRALPVPVSFPADEAGLTDAQLRATPVAVETELVQPLTDAQLRAANVPVTVSNPTASPETGLAKEVTLASILTELGQKLEAGQAVALDAATLAALETISVANFPATQVVTGPLTDAQLRNTPVPVAGAVTSSSPLKALALDYATRSDAQPVYLGSAAPGTADATVAWTVTRYTYESANADARMIRSDVRSPIAWTNRITPTLDGQPGW